MRPFLGDSIRVDENTSFKITDINLRFLSHFEPSYSVGVFPEPAEQIDSLRGEIVLQQHSKNYDECYKLFGEARIYRPALSTHSVDIRQLPIDLQLKLRDTWVEVEKYLKDKTEKVEG